jgi:hypothetical protein
MILGYILMVFLFNWTFIAFIFNKKYWIKIFPIEVIGVFRSIFGEFKKDVYFSGYFIINFATMFFMCVGYLYFVRLMILK